MGRTLGAMRSQKTRDFFRNPWRLANGFESVKGAVGRNADVLTAEMVFIKMSRRRLRCYALLLRLTNWWTCKRQRKSRA
jgi:hypothetical protein